MRKRHYILLTILLFVSCAFVTLKKAGEHKKYKKGITTVAVKDSDGQIGYTEVSYEGSSAKINRSDYESDAEFELAVTEAERTLKKPDPSDIGTIIEIDNSSPVVIETIPKHSSTKTAEPPLSPSE